MTDPTEAAARLADQIAHVENIKANLGTQGQWRKADYADFYGRDIAVLLKFYDLALPLLDATPIDEAWLRSVGPPRDTVLNVAEFTMATTGMYGGTLEFRKSGEVHLAGLVLRHPPKTRGELRLLAKALAITLNETT